MSEMLILHFHSAAEFRDWLAEHHLSHAGFWMKIAKKNSSQQSVSYAEALDEALCYGWIDGQKKPFDAEAWLQRFTPRNPRSIWSMTNVGHIERLTRENRMKPMGIATVEAAKADGRWDRAYHSSSSAELPEDFLAAIAKSPKAMATFETLNKSGRYSI